MTNNKTAAIKTEVHPIRRTVTMEFEGDQEYWLMIKSLWELSPDIAEILVDQMQRGEWEKYDDFSRNYKRVRL